MNIDLNETLAETMERVICEKVENIRLNQENNPLITLDSAIRMEGQVSTLGIETWRKVVERVRA